MAIKRRIDGEKHKKKFKRRRILPWFRVWKLGIWAVSPTLIAVWWKLKVVTLTAFTCDV
jgi:hypothetical protein